MKTLSAVTALAFVMATPSFALDNKPQLVQGGVETPTELVSEWADALPKMTILGDFADSATRLNNRLAHVVSTWTKRGEQGDAGAKLDAQEMSQWCAIPKLPQITWSSESNQEVAQKFADGWHRYRLCTTALEPMARRASSFPQRQSLANPAGNGALVHAEPYEEPMPPTRSSASCSGGSACPAMIRRSASAPGANQPQVIEIRVIGSARVRRR